MAVRDTPYGAYNFVVELNDGSPSDRALGGFSDVSGLGTEITLMEYRQGNDLENRVRKCVGHTKSADATLKRGVCASKSLWDWINRVRQDPEHKHNINIVMQDEQHRP